MKNSPVLFPASIGWLIWVCLHLVFLQQHQVPLIPAIQDAVLFASILFLSAASISRVLKYYKPDWKKAIGFVVGNAAVATGIMSLYSWCAKLVLQPGQKLTDLLPNAEVVLFTLSFLFLLCTGLIHWLWLTLKEREDDSKRKSDQETLARNAELNNLRQQLQPHFLFNSLNSIQALMELDPEKARDMLRLLSDFLRGTVKKEPTQLVSFEEEIKQVRLYLAIESIRFSDRLNIDWSVDDDTLTHKVPVLILQPIIENAVKFGLYGTTGPIRIRISARMNGDMLEISTQNPYDNETGTNQGTGFGLSSVARRLYLLYARNDLLSSKKENQQFIITIRIPS
jgi:two-component system LytT family sensor kinase